MSEAPERIWAEPYDQNHMAGRWTSNPRLPELPTVYIRADLAGLPEDLLHWARLAVDYRKPVDPRAVLRDILAWNKQQKGGGE